jgi:hypothetical protein
MMGELRADFWFAIDRSIVRQHGRPLYGPPAAELIAETARLNCARSQPFLDTGHWISKRDVL